MTKVLGKLRWTFGLCFSCCSVCPLLLSRQRRDPLRDLSGRSQSFSSLEKIPLSRGQVFGQHWCDSDWDECPSSDWASLICTHTPQYNNMREIQAESEGNSRWWTLPKSSFVCIAAIILLVTGPGLVQTIPAELHLCGRRADWRIAVALRPLSLLHGWGIWKELLFL